MDLFSELSPQRKKRASGNKYHGKNGKFSSEKEALLAQVEKLKKESNFWRNNALMWKNKYLAYGLLIRFKDMEIMRLKSPNSNNKTPP